MTLGVGRPSTSVTITLLGLRSRWMIPFWWACCTAWQTATNSSSRARTGSRWRSQYSVIGSPLDQLHHEERLAGLGGAAVVDAGDVGVVHQGQRLPLGVEPGQHRARVHADLDQLERHLPLDRLGLLGPVDGAHPPLAEDFEQRVPAGDDLARDGSAGAVGRRGLFDRGPSAVRSVFRGRQFRRVDAFPGHDSPRRILGVRERPVRVLAWFRERSVRIRRWRSGFKARPALPWAASSASTRARSSGSPPHSRSR